MAKLGISIVNFNAGDFLIKCLDSLEEVKDEADLDIWLVDNASLDGSLEKAKAKFPKINFIENKENLGFSKANNLALKKMTSEYILMLNPDSSVPKGTIKYMLNFMEQNLDVGAASCLIEKADGLIDWASHRSFPTPWVSFLYYVLNNDRLYHLKDRDMTKAHEVDTIVGAFFLTKKSVLDQVGLFDEDYFLYAEDIDLCYRIKQAGFKVMYVPEVKIIHYKGVSSGIKKHSQDISSATNESRIKAFNSFYETMKIFYKKHLAKNYPFFINWLVYLGINLKWSMAKRKMNV
jgi:GT2 family glycosyltransferase